MTFISITFVIFDWIVTQTDFHFYSARDSGAPARTRAGVAYLRKRALRTRPNHKGVPPNIKFVIKHSPHLPLKPVNGNNSMLAHRAQPKKLREIIKCTSRGGK